MIICIFYLRVNAAVLGVMLKQLLIITLLNSNGQFGRKKETGCLKGTVK